MPQTPDIATLISRIEALEREVRVLKGEPESWEEAVARELLSEYQRSQSVTIKGRA